MAVYMISYDLNKAGKNYEGLFKAIKGASVNGSAHVRPLDSTWVIKSALSIEEVNKRIAAQVDADDCWLIFEVTKNVAGTLSQADCDAINKLLAS